tara:strand:- start:3173 stop:3364 length:192 start_codon:yes stop_codon:yes gene_type:complete
MPKSRNRKNHKSKVAAWKLGNQQKINTANKEMMELQEKMKEQWKKKQEEGKEKKDNSVDPKTL